MTFEQTFRSWGWFFGFEVYAESSSKDVAGVRGSGADCSRLWGAKGFETGYEGVRSRVWEVRVWRLE